MSLNFELPGHVGTHADGNVLGYYNFWSYCLYIQLFILIIRKETSLNTVSLFMLILFLHTYTKKLP